MKRGAMNLKGQQSLWFPIILVLALITLIVVAAGTSGGLGGIFDKFSLFPSNLEATVQACNQYATQELKIDYCNEFRKVTIAGEKQYANCDYLASSQVPSVTLDDTLSCDEDLVNDLAKKFCENKLKDSDLVNGAACIGR